VPSAEVEIEDEKFFYPTMEPSTPFPAVANATSTTPSSPTTTPAPELPSNLIAVIQHYWLFVAVIGFAVLLSIWIGFCLLVSEKFSLSLKISKPVFQFLKHFSVL
jgi:hypothetical protein